MCEQQRKVILTLSGLSSNPFRVLEAFQKAAWRQGFKREFIHKVLLEAVTGPYEEDADDYVLKVISKYTIDEEDTE